MQIAVTGATGFIGRPLIRHLARAGMRPIALVRTAPDQPLAEAAATRTGWVLERDDLPWQALRGCDAVIHSAAIAHTSGVPDSAYEAVNHQGTARVARAAARAGVRRLVLVSSVKVFGDQSGDGRFGPDTPPCPVGAYGRSKLAAEQTLIEIARATGLEAVIVRPPLVHGPGVRANMGRLLRLVDLGIPLPFGALRSRRSLVGIDNLVDLLLHAAVHPRAADAVLTVSDGQDVTTPALIRLLARALGRPARLLPLPLPLLTVLRHAARPLVDLGPLLDPLLVDIRTTERLLDWRPPRPLEHGLAAMADWYRVSGEAGTRR